MILNKLNIDKSNLYTGSTWPIPDLRKTQSGNHVNNIHYIK